jgi:membrane protease YdiL (CAAX protease family)
MSEQNIKNSNTVNNSENIIYNPKQHILKFCPNCGALIVFSEELKFCMNCGLYIIPSIPQDKIEEWFGRRVEDAELKRLYAPSSAPRQYMVHTTYNTKMVMREAWGWKSAIGFPLLAYIVKLIVLVIVMLLFSITGLIDILTMEITPEMMTIITIIDLSTQVIFIMIPFFLIGYFMPFGSTNRDKWNAIGIPVGKMNRKQFGKEVLLGVVFSAIMLGFMFITEYLSASFTSWVYQIPIDEILNDDSGSLEGAFPTTIPMLAIFVVLMFVSIGPSEEIMFRGFTQKGFQKSLGEKPAWIVTALYFTLFHIYQYILLSPALFFYSFLPYMVVSLCLGYIYIKRKNLVAVIIAHACYNSIQFIIFFILSTM